ncbi:alpha/beta hydrolase [Ferrimonas balearica]|uniref:alpha/beta hydrolase n=1 Tax=Ferrimonas balearica TaxID=44012 RepID=UPI001C99D7C1|nr:alpha/beta hydrolase [Ferrimonas balearica]MBY5992201.1 alpha/beta hydrolase [Ferrimonas balearica]
MKLLALFLTGYLAMGALLTLFQRQLIYLPSPLDPPSLPSEWVDTAWGRVQVHPLNPDRARALLYFGGNAELVGWSGAELAAALPDHTLYLVNYPGYGHSEGSPSQASLVGAAVAVFDVVAPRHQQVGAIGRSLGSAVVVQLADQRPLARLALVTPFDSITALAQQQMPIYPVTWLVKDPFDNLAVAPELTQPRLVVLARWDQVIPKARSQALIQALEPAGLTVVELPQADHNTLSRYPEYFTALASFFAP